jgi:signal transduction histidine kinase
MARPVAAVTDGDGPPRALGSVDLLAQYVLVPRIAVAGLTFLAVERQPGALPVLLVAMPLIVALNYAALRHWAYVVDELRVSGKPLYLVLDVALAITVIGSVGVGSPIVLYLVGSGLLAGLLYPLRFALAASIAATLLYAAVLATHAGSAPGVVDVHTSVTLPVLVLASGPVAARLRDLLRRSERDAADLARLTQATAIQDERLRMARELHDNVTKNLHGIWLLSRSVPPALDRGDLPQARRTVEVIAETAHRVVGHARQVIHGLRDGDDLAEFSTALAATVDQAGAGHGLEIAVEVAPGVDDAVRAVPGGLGDGAARQLLAIVGEAVHNTVKHAAALGIDVRATVDEGELRVTVRDDGEGFVPVDPAGLAATGHFGLVGMRERAQRCGATVLVDSAVHLGTCVTVTLPLRPAVVDVEAGLARVS